MFGASVHSRAGNTIHTDMSVRRLSDAEQIAANSLFTSQRLHAMHLLAGQQQLQQRWQRLLVYCFRIYAHSKALGKLAWLSPAA